MAVIDFIDNYKRIDTIFWGAREKARYKATVAASKPVPIIPLKTQTWTAADMNGHSSDSVVVGYSRAFSMTNAMARMLFVIMENGFASYDDLSEAISGKSASSSHGSVRVMMHRLKSSIKIAGAVIKSARGAGYSISDDDKDKIDAYVEKIGAV